MDRSVEERSRQFYLQHPHERAENASRSTPASHRSILESKILAPQLTNVLIQESYRSDPVSHPLALPRLPPKGYMRLFDCSQELPENIVKTNDARDSSEKPSENVIPISRNTLQIFVMLGEGLVGFCS